MTDKSLVGEASDMAPRIVPLEPRPTDQENADNLRHMMTNALKDVLEVMDYARQINFVISWQGISPGPNGRHQVVGLDISRHF